MQLPQIFAEITANLPVRRGRLFKQFHTRKAADGTTRETGPYYVLARSVSGKTVSERVKAADAPRVQAEIDRGRRVAELMEGIWAVGEGMAGQAADSKKKRRSAKSKRRS
ncbi:MAG: DUF6788 family protein [Kiritimatiellia bacterium]|jgi:hypothetical protein